MQWASKSFSIEQSDPHIPLKRRLLDGMCGSGCSIEKVGIEKALFRLRKNARFGLRSEIALFNPPIRLHNNWPLADSWICSPLKKYSSARSMSFCPENVVSWSPSSRNESEFSPRSIQSCFPLLQGPSCRKPPSALFRSNWVTNPNRIEKNVFSIRS